MRFKYGGKSRTSSKTDDEELEIGSPSILLRFFGTKNVSMRDGNRPSGYRVIKLATNGGSSYMFQVRPAWPLIISLLISSPYYSLKIFENLFESPTFRCYYLPLKKLKIGNNRKLFDSFQWD